MPEINCRYFNGYKPCGKNEVCDSNCTSRDLIETRLLFIHLEALGAVLRSTSLLRAIKKKYPRSHLTWVTKKPAHLLLQNLSAVDRILTTDPEDVLRLAGLEFDAVFVIDKSHLAAGLLRQVKTQKVFGFQVDTQTQAIVPASSAANELWELGLSDHKKFFINKKPETRLACEALELPYSRDPYWVEFSAPEKELIQERRRQWAPGGEILIGLNTGCAGVIPYKKLTVDFQRQVITQLNQKLKEKVKFVLLGGGPEDTLRNQEIAKSMDVISSPTEQGLRDGLCSVAAVDIVITGDSLGMHMAIAAKKWTVAWFGPTCAHEIDLFERGVAVLSGASCSPCWKRFCDKKPMCYDQVSYEEIEKAVLKGVDWLTSSTKPHLSETSSSRPL